MIRHASLSLLVLTASGCFGSGSLAPPPCEPSDAGVALLLARSCVAGGCHDAGRAGNLDLSGDNPAVRMSDVASGCDGAPLVVPGDPAASYLMAKLGDSPACGRPMPVAGAMPPEDLACIETWIANLAGVCSAGSCVCPAGLTPCAGGCVNLDVNLEHCGMCDHACVPGSRCDGGACLCGPGTTSFARVQEIFSLGCIGARCHDAVNPAADLDLSAGHAYAALVDDNRAGVPASQCSDPRPRVAPGDPGASYLIDKLLGRSMCAGTPMPEGGGGSFRPQIEEIADWICGGAQPP